MKEPEQVTLWESEQSWRMLERSRLISCLQLLEIPWVSGAALLWVLFQPPEVMLVLPALQTLRGW